MGKHNTYCKINPIEKAIILQFFVDIDPTEKLFGKIEDHHDMLTHHPDNRITYEVSLTDTGFGYMATMFKKAHIKYEFSVVEKDGKRILFGTVYHRYTHPDDGQNGYDAFFIRKGDHLVKR